MAVFGRKNVPEPPSRPDPAVYNATTQEFEGFELAFGEFLCGARVNMSSGRIDVVVHHPLFALLSRDGREAAARAALDAALGPAEATEWIGEVGVSADPPIDPLALPLLGHVVDQLRPLRRRRGPASS